MPKLDGPRVQVRLPDGQQLLAVLLSRRQEADRSWWYTVSITLYDKTELRGRFGAEPGEVVFAAPAAACAPVDAEDYSGVPTERALHPTVYAVERRTMAAGRGIPVVHVLACRAGDGHRVDVHEFRARELLERGGALACPQCHPEP